MTDILQRIYASKARQAIDEEAREPYPVVRERAIARSGERRSLRKAILDAKGLGIIAEIKRASPSAGLIARNFDVAGIAASYRDAGADALSVLTESDHFLGELAYLKLARAHCPTPLLRKDFLSTPYHVAQSAAYGADAILLIVAGLSDEQLQACMAEASAYDIDVLVEVHDAGELERAVTLGATLVGINNRNLRTFETDIAIGEYLLPRVPEHVTAIAESGVRHAADAARLKAAGARGLLVGETLMRSEDRRSLIAAIREAHFEAVQR